MFYSFNMNKLPVIHHSYTVTRRTTWQIADNYNILIFVSSGSCEISCNNENYILEKGDVFFIPALQSYTRRPIGDIDCTMYYIHFSADNEPVSSDSASIYNSVSAIITELSVVRNLFSAFDAKHGNPPIIKIWLLLYYFSICLSTH